MSINFREIVGWSHCLQVQFRPNEELALNYSVATLLLTFPRISNAFYRSPGQDGVAIFRIGCQWKHVILTQLLYFLRMVIRKLHRRHSMKSHAVGISRVKYTSNDPLRKTTNSIKWYLYPDLSVRLAPKILKSVHKSGLTSIYLCWRATASEWTTMATAKYRPATTAPRCEGQVKFQRRRRVEDYPSENIFRPNEN